MAKTLGRLLAASAICIAISTSAQAENKIQAAAYRAALQHGTTRVIIMTRADSKEPDGGQAFRRPASYLASAASSGISNVSPIGDLPMVAAVVTPEALENLRRDPNIDAVIQDRVSRPLLMDTVPLTGADVHNHAGFTGKGWTVAVLDSGIDRRHPMFKNAIRSEACFSTSGTFDGATFESLCPGNKLEAFGPGAAANCDMKVMEDCFHGSHVAGIVAGRPATLNDGRKLEGMAPDAGLIIAQIYSKGVGEAACGKGQKVCMLNMNSDLLKAMAWVEAKRNKYHIAALNLSMGALNADGTGFKETCDVSDKPTALIVERMRAEGIAVVVASGNENLKDSIDWPACISTTISVAATDKKGAIDESYSDVAPFVTLAAPGSQIISAAPDGEFWIADGTSMAAPHVAGAIALLREEHPDATVDQIVALLQQKGQTVTDSRSGTKLKRIDMHNIPAGSEEIAALLANPASAEQDAGFNRQTRIAAFTDTDMRTVIVTSDLTAEELRVKLGAACKNDPACTVSMITEKTFLVTVPLAYVDQLDQVRGLDGGLETQIKQVIGNNGDVYRNRVSRPNIMAPQHLN